VKYEEKGICWVFYCQIKNVMTTYNPKEIRMRHKNGCIDLLSVIDLKDFFFSLKEKPFRGERRGTGGR